MCYIYTKNINYTPKPYYTNCTITHAARKHKENLPLLLTLPPTTDIPAITIHPYSRGVYCWVKPDAISMYPFIVKTENIL